MERRPPQKSLNYFQLWETIISAQLCRTSVKANKLAGCDWGSLLVSLSTPLQRVMSITDLCSKENICSFQVYKYVSVHTFLQPLVLTWSWVRSPNHWWFDPHQRLSAIWKVKGLYLAHISSCWCIREWSSPSFCTGPPASSISYLSKNKAKLTCITSLVNQTHAIWPSPPVQEPDGSVATVYLIWGGLYGMTDWRGRRRQLRSVYRVADTNRWQPSDRQVVHIDVFVLLY